MEKTVARKIATKKKLFTVKISRFYNKIITSLLNVATFATSLKNRT